MVGKLFFQRCASRAVICKCIYNDIQVNLAISKSKGKARKYFELSEVVHVQFLQDILLQYMCSQTVPTENRIEMKIKEIHFS